MDDLLNCPFCNGNLPYIGSQANSVGEEYYFVACTKCPAVGPTNIDRADAIRAWNTRPIYDILSGCIEDARSVINTGVELMTLDQLGNWSGVRSWIEQAPYSPEDILSTSRKANDES